MDDPEKSATRPSSRQNTAKGKRPLSASPDPRTEKRQDTKTTIPTSPQKPLSYKDVPQDVLLPSSHPPACLTLTHHTGTLFAAPPNTLLLHACNTQGSWGAGIALAFKHAYPKAYALYHAFCTAEHSSKRGDAVPVGTVLLIPPVDTEKRHWIGCLFTSRKYGKGKDGVEDILQNTRRAIEGLLELVRRVNASDGGGAEGIGGVRMCRINSGKFGVKWERTEEVLRGVVVRQEWMESVEVWDPEEV